jgi:hypothetical protein
MKKLVWLTSLLVVFALLVLPAGLSLGLKYLPANIQPSLDETRDIYSVRTVSQSFMSLKPRLTAIGMTIRNLNLKNKKDLIFSLYSTKGELLRRVIYNGANIEDGDFIKFVFDPIPDSQNQNYTFVLECPTAGAEEVLPVFITKTKPSWLGNLIYNNEPDAGGVAIVAFYKPESKLKVIEEIYSNLFSRL